MVVLYRYFLGNDTGASFTVNLSSELSSFFSTNIDWLIYQYATESESLKELDGSTSYNQTMFTNDLNDSDKTLATAIANFLPASTYYNSSYTAAQKMYEAKKTYNQNYGYSVYKNGLASNFNYSYASDSQASNSGVNSSYLYTNALLASTANNPYLTTTTSINADSISSGSSTVASTSSDSLYNTVLKAIDAVTNSLTVQKAYFDKYTQYVYSNNEYVNAALLGVLSNTSFLSSEIENPILSSYIGDFYTVNNGTTTSNTTTFNSFKLTSNPFGSGDTTTNIQTYLQNAMYNFYFLSSFTGETDSLFSYGVTDNTKSSTNVADSSFSSSISLDNIRKYRWDLWNSSNKLDYSSQVVNYNALYKTIATVKYLLGTDLSNFLSYMRDLVGNNNAFVVWENSQNVNTSSLANSSTTTKESDTTNSSSIPTSQSLISYNNPITNINNQSYGPYVGKNNSSSSSSPLTYNVYSGNLYQSTLNSSYYSATTNNSSTKGDSSSYKMGFKGLQTTSNKSLSDDVSDVLFTNPWKTNIGTKGVLYQYKSLENLKNIVNGISSISDLTTLVTNIDTLTNFKFNFSDDISSEISLSAKKSKLVNSLQANLGTTSSSSSNDYFTPFSGYVGVNSTTSSTNNVSAYGSSTSKYGIFAYQLNADSFTSLDSLRKALGANGTKDTSSNDQADEIICNLIVQYAAQSTNQSYIIPTIVKDSRVDIYDIRVYNAFSSDGLTWVKNWRTITTSSGNSSDSSSGSSD